MFKDYLKKTYSVYLLYLLFVLCTFVVLMICQMISDLIIYMLSLYFFIILLYFLLDYRKYKHHHQYLIYLKDNPELFDNLPQESYLEEKTYQEMLQILQKKIFQLKQENQQKYNNTIDYYTKWVHQIKTPIAGLKLIIQNDYPDLDSIHHDLSFQKVSLDHLVSQEIKKQSLFFFQKNLKVDYQIKDLQILTDEKWSGFVIEQVLSNALKYTKEGSISFYNEGEKLYIQDSGIGIKESDLPRVFEKGFTGFQGRNDKKASGLGLYLCKNIFNQLGHLISIESKVGQGTTVCLDFSKKEIFIE